MIEHIRSYFEKRTFGVCEWWGEKLGISSSRVRKYFIYTSFITFGSPLILYLVMAFMLEHKEWFRILRKPRSVWDF
ncbi:MAG: PspC family transcriptional regulator [Flavobacteriales bacterium]